MKIQNKSLGLGLVICLSFNLLQTGCAGKKMETLSLDPTSQKFLDIIRYIILPIEEKIYREMPPEDRGEFIRDFWARRDTDPSTPENEFRETYYARLATADKAFRTGVPGWMTDRGRIFILLGPPMNVIKKTMGDVPYEQNKFFTANPIETGTLTERPTEIWVYDSYPEFFKGPLSLVFVDYHSTGDYKLTTNIEITPFSMVSPTWDEPDMPKYQFLGQIQEDEVSLEEYRIFDYGLSLQKIFKDREGAAALLAIDVPYRGLNFSEQSGNFTCDFTVNAEVLNAQKTLVSTREIPVSQTLSKTQLLDMLTNNIKIHQEIDVILSKGENFIYISLDDKIKGKRLRKLIRTKGD